MATKKSTGMKRKAQKTLGSLGSKILGKKQEEVKNPEEQGAEQIARANEMVSILKCIRFDTSPLPAEILEKKHSPTQKKTDMELFRDAGINILNRGAITELDTEKIDETLRYAVNTFEEGIKNGQPEKAQRGGFAVLFIANTLRREVDETEREMAQQIKAEREEMCDYIKTMLKQCRRIDAYEGQRAKKLVNFDNGTKETQKLQDELQAYLNTDEGAAVLQELEDHMIHPDKRSIKAQELDSRFTLLARKEDHLFTLRGELSALTHAVSEENAQLEQVLETINGKGYVEDPELQSRVEEIMNERVKALTRLQEQNKRVSAALDAHDEAMKAAISDPTNAERTAKNLEYWDKKQKKEKEQAERERAAREKRLEELREQRKRQERDAELDREIEELQENIDQFEDDIEDDVEMDFEEQAEKNHLYNE